MNEGMLDVVSTIRLGVARSVFRGFAYRPGRRRSQPPSPQSPSQAQDSVLLGYSSSSSAREASWEEKFRAGVSPGNIRDTMQRLTARPHNVGSPYDKDNAEWILARFKEWGFDAHIETFDVLFPTPKERLLEMVKPTVFRASLQEPPIAEDPTSSQTAEQLPTYNAYSADGDVTAPLVYVNLRQPGRLREARPARHLGEGRHRHRALRRRMAWRQAESCRGARCDRLHHLTPTPRAMDISRGISIRTEAGGPRKECSAAASWTRDYPGDPLTPGVGATAQAKRLAIKDAKTITKIPGAADLLCRRAAPPVGARRTGRAPSNGAGPCPSPITSGRGRPSCICKVSLELGPEADLRRDRDPARLDRRGRMGAARQPPRCLGERRRRSYRGTGGDAGGGARRWASCARTAGSPRAPSSTARGTARSRGCSARSSGSRPILPICKSMRSHIINSDTNKRGYMLPGGTQDLENFISASRAR